MTPERLARSKAKFDVLMYNVKVMHDAGVQIGVGTDAGETGTPHGSSTLLEMQLLVKAGLTPAQALVAGTKTSAQMMGLDKDRGTIEVGKRADLVLIDGKPWITIDDVTRTDSVLIDGTTEPFEAPHPVRLTSVVGIRDLGRLLAHDDLDAGVAARLTVEGQWGGRDSTRLEGTILGSGRFGALSLDSLQTRLGLAGGVLRVDTLDMRSNVGAATATGTIALFGPVASARSSLRVQATLSDLAPLGATLGLDGLGLDSGRVTLAVEGTRDRPSLRADVEGTGLAIGGRRVGVVRGSVHGEFAPDRSIGTGDGELLLERVYAPGTTASNVHLQGSYRAAELALRGQVDQYGGRRARLAARAYPGSGEGRVELDTIEVRSETESWTLAHPVRITYGKQLRVDDLIISSAGRRLAIDGTVDREGEQRLGVQLDSFPVGWLAEIAGLPTLEGEINGSFALSGAAASPRLAGGLDVALQSRGKTIGQIGRAHV